MAPVSRPAIAPLGRATAYSSSMASLRTTRCSRRPRSGSARAVLTTAARSAISTSRTSRAWSSSAVRTRRRGSAVAPRTVSWPSRRGADRSRHPSPLFASVQQTGESAVRLPTFQNQYGQGLNGQFQFFNGRGGGVNDADRSELGAARLTVAPFRRRATPMPAAPTCGCGPLGQTTFRTISEAARRPT